MSGITRREALLVLASATAGAAIGVSPAVFERVTSATRKATAAGGFRPAFFTPHEWRTVQILADLVIPADERSGSATDAGVPAIEALTARGVNVNVTLLFSVERYEQVILTHSSRFKAELA